MNDGSKPVKTLKDALLLAAKNVEFGEHLMTNPESLREEYNLSDEQIDQIRNLGKMNAPFDEAALTVANYEDGGGGGNNGGNGGGNGNGG